MAFLRYVAAAAPGRTDSIPLTVKKELPTAGARWNQRRLNKKSCFLIDCGFPILVIMKANTDRSAAPPATKPPPVRLAYTIWGLGAIFYLIGFYQRVAPAVITTELMSAFGISAAALGNLSAFYYYSYVAMQIPTGILADRWGPRRLLATGCLVAGLGTLLFALAATVHWANLGRLLIGGSVAVAFISILQLAGHWFPSSRFAMLTGLSLLSGVIGAVGAGVPLRWLTELFGWRPVMVVSAGVTLITGTLIWLRVRDQPHEMGYRDYLATAATQKTAAWSGILADFKELARYRNTWLLFWIPGGIVGCVLTFGGLWGVPYLTTHYAMSVNQASSLTSATLVAWALAGPLYGAWSDRLGRRKTLFVGGAAAVVAGWSVVLLVPRIPIPLLVILLLLSGFAAGCMVLTFVFAKESVPRHLAGTVSGVVNMGVMMGPMLLQPAVGWMMDLYWRGAMVNGVRHYSLTAYRAGFLLIVAWILVSLMLVCFTRETHCRQMVE